MSRQHSLLRKDVLQTFGGFLWKVIPRNAFCLWSFFNVTETEISEVEEEIEIQDVTGIFNVLFSSWIVYSDAF